MFPTQSILHFNDIYHRLETTVSSHPVLNDLLCLLLSQSSNLHVPLFIQVTLCKWCRWGGWMLFYYYLQGYPSIACSSHVDSDSVDGDRNNNGSVCVPSRLLCSSSAVSCVVTVCLSLHWLPHIHTWCLHAINTGVNRWTTMANLLGSKWEREHRFFLAIKQEPHSITPTTLFHLRSIGNNIRVNSWN